MAWSSKLYRALLFQFPSTRVRSSARVCFSLSLFTLKDPNIRLAALAAWGLGR